MINWRWGAADPDWSFGTNNRISTDFARDSINVDRTNSLKYILLINLFKKNKTGNQDLSSLKAIQCSWGVTLRTWSCFFWPPLPVQSQVLNPISLHYLSSFWNYLLEPTRNWTAILVKLSSIKITLSDFHQQITDFHLISIMQPVS